MKKYIFIFIVILVLAFGSGVYADSFFAEISGDKLLMRNTADDGSIELKSVEIYNLEDYKYFGIRAMSECCGAEVSWDDSTKTVIVKHNDLVISLKSNNSDIFINGNKYNFGYPVIIIDGKAYAPLELYKAFTGELKTTSTGNMQQTAVNSETEKGIIIEHGDGSDRINIIGGSTGFIHEFMLSNPYRIVLDVSGINIEGTYSNGQTYDKIRHFKGSDGITRIVFDLNANYKYIINYEGNNIVLTISNDGSFEETQELIEFRNNSVIINTANYSGYRISRSTDPFSIIATIPTKLINSPFKIDIGGEYVNAVSTEIIDNNTIIKIELKQQCAFELEKLSETFIIGIYAPVVNGVTYHNFDEKQYISLDFLPELDSIQEIDNKAGEIVITVNDQNSTIKAGQVYVNDEFIKSLFVSKSGSNTTIKITTKEIKFAKAEIVNGIPSLVLYDNDYSEFLVVISAGHGGSDPGAIVNGVYESHLNLDISKKIRSELENAGVNIHMIRIDDSFVSLDDRTEIANNLGADLFISIHCNTLEDETFDGLMTLVHSGSINYDRINGKTAGTIIHEEVIAQTGATDRGVRNRDKIIVLKNTAMPAVEIECGFLTNTSELGKLLEDSYQWSIARGTAEGVLKVLDLMD